MQPWIYEGQPITEDQVQGYVGFVYLIICKLTQRKYIGKKQLFFSRKNKKTGRRKSIDSDWKEYWGSCEPLTEDIHRFGIENFQREIIHLCSTKKAMSFYEQKEQWERDVLRTDEYYNTNIGGKFFVRERHLYYREYQITPKNDRFRQIMSERMKGDKNIAKREDVRKKISEKKKGENNSNFGKTLPPDHLTALRRGHKEKVAKLVTNGEKIWLSMTECTQELGINYHEFRRQVKLEKLRYLDHNQTVIDKWICKGCGKEQIEKRKTYERAKKKQFCNFECSDANSHLRQLKDIFLTGVVVTVELSSTLGFETPETLRGAVRRIRKKYGLKIIVSKKTSPSSYQIATSADYNGTRTQ